MMAFFLILTIGSLYEWKRGASDRDFGSMSPKARSMPACFDEITEKTKFSYTFASCETPLYSASQGFAGNYGSQKGQI
ncbi:NADH-ubiquinone oxidoreductase chain 3 [Platanthera guangdongensis]|uniref:NADH-ubiquinone oxidoreductase chain 3 n=1 Tax=Platanthera guangdongensis TaxID=2320717 RepID=A0ABR2M2G8_9ASPA